MPDGMATVFPAVLVVDDEEVVLDSCAMILEGQGYAVQTARDGSTALELVPSLRPELVLTDVRMPGVGGLELLEQIHRIDPAIVVVVITGFGTVDLAVEAMRSGAYDFIAKPFTPEQLRRVVRLGLDHRRLELRAARLESEKEALSDNFAAIVSHELKSPLGAVQQNLYALERELASVADEDQRERMRRMRERIADLLRLVDTWLRGISVDIGGIRERFGPVAIGDVIRKAIDAVEPVAVRKSVELVVSVDEVSAPVLGDEGTLVEAIANVAGNAIKYSYEEGSVIVAARDQGDRIAVEITDHGIGITPKDRDRIFDDFYRSATAGGTGAGLGLAISRRIIEAHGGDIRVESEPGKGATFTILLPVCVTINGGEPSGPCRGNPGPSLPGGLEEQSE
ncbi:MAG: HAMP domain-containing histidine kinase [Actinobacteria bacterium]|nr:HAMP domain-containing histidine kinase [Actinomycetota bacterium]